MAVLLVATTLVACGRQTRDVDDEPSVGPEGACEVDSERGDVTHLVEVDGEERKYLMYAPAGLPTDKRLPVVYLFHGLDQTPSQVVAYTKFDQAAAQEGFIVIAPLGGEEGPGWDIEPGGRDAKFISALTDAVVERHCADPAQQFAAGMSNGSALAFSLACTGGFPFAAYGGVAFVNYDGCEAAPPASFIYFHGTSDYIVPYAGGETKVGEIGPIAESVAAWVAHDQCGQAQVYEEPAEDLQHWEWTCPSASVEAYVVLGGGHTWPGASAKGPGVTTNSVDATDAMVEFFGIAKTD